MNRDLTENHLMGYFLNQTSFPRKLNGCSLRESVGCFPRCKSQAAHMIFLLCSPCGLEKTRDVSCPDLCSLQCAKLPPSCATGTNAELKIMYKYAPGPLSPKDHDGSVIAIPVTLRTRSQQNCQRGPNSKGGSLPASATQRSGFSPVFAQFSLQ